MKNSRFLYGLIIFILAFFLGFLIIRQFYFQKEIKKVTSPDQTEALAIEVGELLKNTEKQHKQVEQLKVEKDNLQKSIYDRSKAEQTMDENIAKYQILTGTTKVQGEGVEITIDYKLTLAQQVDLLNALRNIGAEAIAINNKRITPKTGLDQNTFSMPYGIQVIGNKNILYEALTRRGGIIEQLGQAEVSKKDKLILPAS
jgi:uncharacterized protein YlxW (UPF0749 family)